MSDLLAARSQMAMSLAFHIVFAVVGIAMPLLMVLAERAHLRTGSAIDLELAKRWSKGTAIMFAVGAVSGTVLSFELGLLWPEFMEHAGPVIGMPFSMEGFAFFLEAIFLGIYLYGWDRVSPRVHLLSGVGVLVAGTLSGIFVLSANSWMNSPTGFRVEDGTLVDIDVVAALLNPMWASQALHMTIAAFLAVGFAVAGIHALMLLRHPGDPFHRRALGIALSVGGVAALVMPLSGDYLAKRVADTQPVKLAAMEGQFRTERSAPLRIGGFPNERTETTDYAIEIPGLLSYLAQGDLDAEVLGLEEFPVEERPPVAVVHVAFQIMVALGMFFVAVTIAAAVVAWRRRGVPDSPWLLRVLAFSIPLGVVAIESGWVVTEVGRQPWIIYRIMRVADAVTPMPHLVVPFTLFSLLYLFLAGTVFSLMKRLVFQSAPTAAGIER
jgi:cytochrome bd ubiquinol oxidase subunit I